MISLLSALIIALPLAWIAYELHKQGKATLEPVAVGVVAPESEPEHPEMVDLARMPDSLRSWIDLESEAWAREEMMETALRYYSIFNDWAEVEAAVRASYAGQVGSRRSGTFAHVAEQIAWSTTRVSDEH